jgi:uncharacterized damage-inducible protein DinB
MTTDKQLRAQLADAIDSRSAHVPFDRAVRGLPPALRGVIPIGFEHSVWQLVEHLRIAQHDILDFCRNPKYEELTWPDDYWPKPRPAGADAWTRSLAAYRRDSKALQRLALNPRLDLFAKIPHGSGQTCLRELLLVADHAAYHIAQIVDVRRALGIWT